MDQDIKSELNEHIEKLQDKYEKLKQPTASYLEGLYHAKPVNYWDYVELDTLLTLQKPRTDFPDEKIFIMYHQVTELYFNMILSESKQIAEKKDLEPEWFAERVRRISRYFDCLISSFTVMADGMEVEQYLQFRMALVPASGFQSAQYRMIEISATDFVRLVRSDVRDNFQKDSPIEDMIESAYWKSAGIDHKTGEKSLTLTQFEDKYQESLIEMANDFRNKNILARYLELSAEDQNNDDLVSALRGMDRQINIDWPIAHYSVAEKYLVTAGGDVEATGGSHWKKYMHPKYQRRIFFPQLWSEEELEHWGEDV